MAYFKRDRFSGIAPGVSPRLLAEQFGQIAENLDFDSGRLVSINGDSEVYTLQSALRRSIFFYRDTSWLEWDAEGVVAVEGPIPGDTLDRLYFSGDDYPRIGTVQTLVQGSSGFPVNSYRLGVPAPSGTCTVVKTGTADATQTPIDVSYVWTLVTALGEEGPPCYPSAVIELTDTESVTIALPTSQQPSGNYNFGAGALKRIYRSNSGSNSTAFQFAGETAYTDIEFVDILNSSQLGEVLPSSTWIGPPNDDSSLYPDGPLRGLLSLAGGVMAGFTGKRFCLSEPYLPHAWPVSYRITTEEDIVAIASTANGVAALTNGRPYFITGTDPSAMTAIRVDLAQACVNINSVVDMGDYVLYAGPDGLCALQSAEGRVVTQGLVSPRQWNADFNPTTLRAFRHEGTYVAFHASGGFVYDPRSEENSLSTLSLAADVRGGYMNPKDGELYIIVGNKIKKYRGSSAKRTLTFKSKKFVTPKPLSMGWVSVHANEYPVTVKVWGDGVLVAHYVLSKTSETYTQTTTLPTGISAGTLRQPVMRLPAIIAQEWEVQVQGTDINEFCLAQSTDELNAV
jgi:hypothetical protein